MHEGDGHLPDGDVGEHRAEELAQRQRHQDLHGGRPPLVDRGRGLRAALRRQVPECGSAVRGYGGQLRQRHGQRERQRAEQHLADDIVAARRRVPDDAQRYDGERFARAATAAAARHLPPDVKRTRLNPNSANDTWHRLDGAHYGHALPIQFSAFPDKALKETYALLSGFFGPLRLFNKKRFSMLFNRRVPMSFS